MCLDDMLKRFVCNEGWESVANLTLMQTVAREGIVISIVADIMTKSFS